jgi:hypothetical protein
MLLAMLLLAAAPGSSSAKQTSPPAVNADAGADLSDEEFAKTFGKARARKGDSPGKTTAYVPPPPGAGAPPPLEKLEPRHVMDVVLAARADIKRCADGQPNLRHGKSTLTLQWSIGLDGKVTKVDTVGEELKGTYVAGCVSRLVRRWQFPRHTAAAEPVVFPFKL